ncbi:MAG: tRNA preQ1(34) S-adenosylmethionine ribosyltransferase-isomerase QueA [Acidiferrobacterales bacterium]|nr:tRNA preQ1(34) S-adenosylmethionine ribosyltransferase-isomerase QueA [Acidiferrobacterales bacterium]
MNVSDFSFELPPELIAQYPSENRTDSRLLKVPSAGAFEDLLFPAIERSLRKDDLIVLNNTKVLPARLFGQKDTGGRIEILLERVLNESRFMAQIRASKAPKIGQSLQIDADDQQANLVVAAREGQFFIVDISVKGGLFDWLQKVGHMPLPPYIERADQVEDQTRYQTVFAEKLGAVAAPTAGLHYDDELLQKLKDRGVEFATVTLHVGAGTYQPVRVEKLQDHVMHSEYIEVDQAVCNKIIATKRNGGRVMAVGTTVIRTLETAAENTQTGLIQPYSGDTDIFIYPGFEFKVVDLLQTNFHLPESTLMMLVSAFAGYERIMQAYQHAIEQRYRFFSYGDAMLLERKLTD